MDLRFPVNCGTMTYTHYTNTNNTQKHTRTTFTHSTNIHTQTHTQPSITHNVLQEILIQIETRTKNVHKKRSCNNVTNDIVNLKTRKPALVPRRKRSGTAKKGKTVNKTRPDRLSLKQDFQNCLWNFSTSSIKEVMNLFKNINA